MPKKIKTFNSNKSSELVTSSGEGQIYGTVKKMLGGCWFTVDCIDKTQRRCILRKGRRRRVRHLGVGDIILISLREFDDTTGDILEKYNREQVRELMKVGEISNDTNLLYKSEEDIDDVFVFEDI